MASFSNQPTDDDEESAGCFEEMHRPSVSPVASSSPLVAPAPPSHQGHSEVESITDDGAAFGSELDVLMSQLAVSPSSEDVVPPPSGDIVVARVATDGEAAPKADEKPEIISDDEAPTPNINEDADVASSLQGRHGRVESDARAAGDSVAFDAEMEVLMSVLAAPPSSKDGAAAMIIAMDEEAAPKAGEKPEIISDDEDPIPYIHEAPEPAPNSTSAQSSAPTVVEGRLEIFSDDRAPTPAVQALSDAEYKLMVEAKGITNINDDDHTIDQLMARSQPSPPALTNIDDDDATIDQLMVHSQPSPSALQDDGDLHPTLTIAQGLALSPAQSMLVPPNGTPDAQLQSTPAIEATVVQGVEATLIQREVVIAEPVSFFERKWKGVAAALIIFLLALVLLLAFPLSNGVNNTAKESVIVMPPTDVPSMQPSSPPSLDSRPTLEIVQMRGHIRCGMPPYVVDPGEGLDLDLCRSVAAVLFGNPDNIVGVPDTIATRFQLLRDKKVDVLLGGVTRTVEREVRERTAGVGFTFSSAYYYDGITYMGNETYARCAEELVRVRECASLSICIGKGSTGNAVVRSSFPSDFYHIVTTFDEVVEMLTNDTCNVLASGQLRLLHIASNVLPDRNFIVGEKLLTKEPLAIVTRKDDVEFSDIVNWVVQSLFYGEEQGLTKDLSKCREYNSLAAGVSDLVFSNAFYCMGNYAQILAAHYQNNRGMNQINNGTTGMHYAIPFGKLEHNDGALGDIDVTDSDALLGRIRREGSLNCGVTVPFGFTGELLASDKLVGMSVDYCRVLAAALFNGNHKAVKILPFPGEGIGSFSALDDGTIDVLAGAKIARKYDFGSPSSLIKGFQFSTPYYYGNETAADDVSFHSLATRDGDVLFSSFVNCVVSATIFAEEQTKKSENIDIPMSSIFGSEFSWALIDAIDYSGSYDLIYRKNFGDVAEKERGRNSVNNDATPQILSFPGIHQ